MPRIFAVNYVTLGTGRTMSASVGNKGALLDRAARAGLPVPPGVVLLDEAWEQAKGAGLVAVHDGAVTAPDAARLIASLHLPHELWSDSLVAVRSAFSAEDGAGESLAGFFTSRLFVDPRDPRALADALCAVWSSASRRPGAFRRDVLILAMVDARQAGVAFTEREFEDDLVNFTGGTADTLVSGEVAGQGLSLPKLRRWERPTTALSVITPGAPFAERLQVLLRDVRGAFGPSDWDTEWADDGQTCWLVQIRPVTRPSRRDEAFSVANHKEILPPLPSRLMASVIASCAAGLFDYYRALDPGLPAHRPFIEVFRGRPFINLSLLSDMLRDFGLPSRLVTASLGGEADREYGANPGRMLRKLPVLLRLAALPLRAAPLAEGSRREMLARTIRPAAGFAEAIDTLRWLYTTLVTTMFSLGTALTPPLALLRAAGVLEELSAANRTLATAGYGDLDPLRRLIAADPAARVALARGDLPAKPQFRALWDAYLAKHGHRGIYESDIARPRYREAPAPLLAGLATPAPARRSPRRTLRGALLRPLWWPTGRLIRAREALRYTAMIAFERSRDDLLALATRAAATGQLPTPDAIWSLDVDELRALDAGWRPDAAFFAARAAEQERFARYDFPDLFHRFDDLEAFRTDNSPARTDDTAPRRLSGLSLTTGQVAGRAWVLAEPGTVLPPGYTPETTILVARSVDAGWLPTFSRVAGVVVETGGDLSHGSILLREIGLPAITNTRRATHLLATGDRLLLRAGEGVVERIE